jgi:hypothetical protein
MGKKKKTHVNVDHVKIADESEALNDEISLEPTEVEVEGIKFISPKWRISHGYTDKNGNKAEEIFYPDQDYQLEGEILKVYEENPSYFTKLKK